MAKTPTTKPPSAIDTPTPATPTPKPWEKPAVGDTPGDTIGQTPTVMDEPPAGTPLTAEERAANGLDDPTLPETAPPETPPVDTPPNDEQPPQEHALNAPPPEDVPPIEDSLTLTNDDTIDDEPVDANDRPDGFVVGDQTAAGALTPPEGQNPGAPKDLLPGQPVNLQDPYNVNGTQRNHELLAMGHGIRNPLLDEQDPNTVAAQSDAEDAEGDD